MMQRLGGRKRVTLEAGGKHDIYQRYDQLTHIV